jgi:phospholipid N-methyltransferase
MTNRQPSIDRDRDVRRRRGARARQDLRAFVGAWLKDPVGIASIAPSGASLARLITSQIGPGDGPVIELGAGTGVFTEALITRGVREQDLVLVESQPDLAALLRSRYPQASVLQSDAALLAEGFPCERLARAAISGLPLIWMDQQHVARILSALFDRLQPGAALFQFTYQAYCPVPRAVRGALGLDAQRIGWTLANLPPAAVYRITRIAS